MHSVSLYRPSFIIEKHSKRLTSRVYVIFHPWPIPAFRFPTIWRLLAVIRPVEPVRGARACFLPLYDYFLTTCVHTLPECKRVADRAVWSIDYMDLWGRKVYVSVTRSKMGTS